MIYDYLTHPMFVKYCLVVGGIIAIMYVVSFFNSETKAYETERLFDE